MSDVTETPDLGINPEPDDEELPEDEAVASTDEEWEASAQTQVVDDEAAPESEELADADDEDELVEAEAEVDADQPDEPAFDVSDTPTEQDDGEGSDEPVAEEPVEEEKPKRKRGGKGKGKGKAKAADKPKRSRDPNSRERGALALDVKSVTDAFDKGDIELEEGQTLTPHRIANLIKDRDGLEKAPSTGAVTNVIKKWEEVGYCLTSESPFAYRRVSAKGKKEGLDALLEKDKEKKKKERAKAKADAAA